MHLQKVKIVSRKSCQRARLLQLLQNLTLRTDLASHRYYTDVVLIFLRMATYCMQLTDKETSSTHHI